MVGTFLTLLLVLALIAALLRGDFALTLIYLVAGALAAGMWWVRRSLAQVEAKRRLNTHAFLGERIRIDLQVQNKGWLPLPWLELRDTLPVALAGPNSFQAVVQLGAHAQEHFEYSVEARKRGYYTIGPLDISTGDLLGLSEPVLVQGQTESLVVYPKTIPITAMDLPSQSPQGTFRHRLPMFEDPTRVFGKRGYTSGDSLRRIDWKASAISGHLQVKLFEPSIALETYIILDLNPEDYYFRSRIDATELAIVIAASVCNWLIGKKQMVGMMVNGRDPLAADGRPQPIPPHKGKHHLMRLLEMLARVEMGKHWALGALIQQQRYQLAWGTTLIVITGRPGEGVLDELYQARRKGQNAVLILAGRNAGDEAMRRRAKVFDVPVFSVATEHDLEIWTQKSRGA